MRYPIYNPWYDTLEELLRHTLNYTLTEGAEVLIPGAPKDFRFHTLFLDDGREWDVINGYRRKYIYAQDIDSSGNFLDSASDTGNPSVD